MNIAELEQDLASIERALEQSAANHNVLTGQKQGIEHVIKKIKAGAQTVESVADIAEAVIETVDPEPAVAS